MDFFFYFFQGLEGSLDEIEDTVQETLGDKGEFTGSGLGKAGASIDVDVNEDEVAEEAGR